MNACRTSLQRSWAWLQHHVWPAPLWLCLAALTLQSLAASLSSEGSVTLYFFLNNLDWPFAGVSGVMAAVSVVVALFAMLAAPWVEQVREPLLPTLVSLVTLFLRFVFAGLASFLPWRDLTQGWTGGVFTLLLLLLHMLEQCFMGQWLMLAMDRSVELMQHTPKNEWPAIRTRLWGLNYSLSNATIALALGLYDVLRTWESPSAQGRVANVFALWLSVAMNMGTFLVLWALVRFYSTPSTSSHPAITLLANDGGEEEETMSSAPDHDTTSDTPFHVTQQPGSGAETKQPLWRDIYFRRFVVFCLILQGVQSLFRHMDQTVPLVLQRLYTDKVHFAWVQAVNPLLIIVLAPLMQWRTAKWPGYWVIVGGSAISSSAVLFLLFGPNNGGVGEEAQWWDYLPFGSFMALFSVGEALWSARLTSYMLGVAPRGQKATYLAVARLPLLMARLLLALEASLLLFYDCPAAGRCFPRMLWLIVWIGSALTPFLLTVFFRLVRPERRPEYEWPFGVRG